MKIKELKQYILTKRKLDQFMVFVYKDNDFLANQYINSICENNNLQKQFVDTLQETKTSTLSLVFDQSDILNIINLDEFNENLEDYSTYTNCIVVCKKINKLIEEKVEPFCIEFPALADWQIKDYILSSCKGLDQYDADWLYKAVDGNIYRIDNECNKIKLFIPSEQQCALSDLRFEQGSMLYSQNIFDFSKMIIYKDIGGITDYLSHKSAVDFDAFAIIGLLLADFKKVLFVNFNSGLTAEQLGMTPKQWNGIKYYYKDFSKEYVEESIRFLTSLDEKIKTNKLDIPKANLIDYIICNILSFGA